MATVPWPQILWRHCTLCIRAWCAGTVWLRHGVVERQNWTSAGNAPLATSSDASTQIPHLIEAASAVPAAARAASHDTLGGWKCRTRHRPSFIRTAGRFLSYCLSAILEWWGAGVVVCLERGADLHMAQLMPLPLTVSCFSKIQIGFTFLVSAHPGSHGQRAVKRVCVCLCVSATIVRPCELELGRTAVGVTTAFSQFMYFTKMLNRMQTCKGPFLHLTASNSNWRFI